jgi:hypothetical protein
VVDVDAGVFEIPIFSVDVGTAIDWTVVVVRIGVDFLTCFAWIENKRFFVLKIMNSHNSCTIISTPFSLFFGFCGVPHSLFTTYQ